MATMFSYHFTKAQTETNYSHCDCKEIINYSDNDSSIKNGEYVLNCENSLVEKGSYKNGKKDGIWTVKNGKGQIVSKIEFSEGKLKGNYELFTYDGNPKLKAKFVDNRPTGEWKYFNKKDRIIKQGSYANGRPIGTWKVYDKKGKKVIEEYDFDTNKSLISTKAKIKNSYLPRDDESGEYIIIYYPSRKHLTKNIPFEGNIVANKEFIDLFNMPFVLMDTFTKYHFKITAKINEGTLLIEDIDYFQNIDYDANTISFPYIAQTNSPNKIKEIKHSKFIINKMKERIFETLMVLGPWVSNTNDSFEIHIPFVLNKIKGN
jgi:hypothetical protein